MWNSVSRRLCSGRDQVAVHAGQQAVGQFDHRDLAAQGGVDVAHLQADVAAADDQQRRRARPPAARPPVESMTRGLSRLRAGRPRRDWSRWRRCSAESGARRPLSSCSVCGVHERGPRWHELDLAAACTAPAGCWTGCRRPCAMWPRSAVDVDLGRREVMPQAPASRASVMSLAACSRALDGMQPTCRQVPPGLLVRVDQRDLHALVGRQERRGVAAGPGPDDHQFACLRFGHGRVPQSTVTNLAAVVRSVRSWPSSFACILPGAGPFGQSLGNSRILAWNSCPVSDAVVLIRPPVQLADASKMASSGADGVVYHAWSRANNVLADGKGHLLGDRRLYPDRLDVELNRAPGVSRQRPRTASVASHSP